MFVVKRDGREEVVHFDKITSRIAKLCYGLDPVHVDATVVSQKVGAWLRNHPYSACYVVFLDVEMYSYSRHV